MSKLILVSAILGAVLLPAGARAATVHVGPDPGPRYPCCTWGVYGFETVFYVAAPGEVNHVVVSSGKNADGFPDITINDPGAVISAGDRCISLDEHTARCSVSSGLQAVEADLGDGNDELHVSASGVFQPSVRALGGPGDDLLVGGRFGDELHGGGGRDMLLGGEGNDALQDEDRSGASDADLMDGGPGNDLVDYQGRTAPVTVDLGTAAPAGEQGEGDTIRDIEAAAGGRAADRLTGSAADNQLFGHAGDDVLIAGAGNDRVYGGRGRDRIEVGDGDDVLDPGDGIDSLSCGLGKDIVLRPMPGEVIGRCESIIFDGLDGGSDLNYLELPPHPTTSSRTFVKFVIPCPSFDIDDGSPRTCAGTLTIRTASGGHRLLGRALIPEGRSHVVRVQLTALGRRLIRRRQGVIATISLRGGGSAQRPLPNVAWTIRLRAF